MAFVTFLLFDALYAPVLSLSLPNKSSLIPSPRKRKARNQKLSSSLHVLWRYENHTNKNNNFPPFLVWNHSLSSLLVPEVPSERLFIHERRYFLFRGDFLLIIYSGHFKHHKDLLCTKVSKIACLCVLGPIYVILPLVIKEWGWATGTLLVLAPKVTETNRDLSQADKERQPVFQSQSQCSTSLVKAGQNFDLLLSVTHCLHLTSFSVCLFPVSHQQPSRLLPVRRSLRQEGPDASGTLGPGNG